jgi:hypothetical protein
MSNDEVLNERNEKVDEEIVLDEVEDDDSAAA